MRKQILVSMIVSLFLAVFVFVFIQRHEKEVLPDVSLQELETEQVEKFKMPVYSELEKAHSQDRIVTLKDLIRKEIDHGTSKEEIVQLEAVLELERLVLTGASEESVLKFYDRQISLAIKSGDSEANSKWKNVRDNHLNARARSEALIRQLDAKLEARRETRAHQTEKELAAFRAMSDEERVPYYENEIKELEEKLQVAISEHDTKEIKVLEMFIEGKKLSLELTRGRIEWDRKNIEWDRKRAERDKKSDSIIGSLKDAFVFEKVNGEWEYRGGRDEWTRSFEVEVLPSSAEWVSDNPSFEVSPSLDVSVPTDIALEPLDTSVSSSLSSFDPVGSLTVTQESLTPWRTEITDVYFDVVVSQYMTPAELDKYFPTESDREMLKSRTAEMQKTVVSKIRKVISDLPNASADQKREFARQLVSQNFEKDFAESVLKTLEVGTN